MDLKCAVRVVFAKWCPAHTYIYYKTILFYQLNESLQCANDCLKKNLSKWASTICEALVVEVHSFVIWSALLTIALLLVKEVEAQAATLSQAISKTVWLIFCYLQKGYTFPLSLSVRWLKENIYTNVKCLWNTRWDRLDEERRVT